MTAITITGLSVTLGNRRILNDINLAIQPGEVVGILGPNGAGKSTLLKACLGLVPLTAGKASLDGRSILDLSPVDRAKRAAYVSQDREIAWSLTVEHIVALGRIPYRSAFAAPTSKDQTAIERAMADAKVTDLRRRPIAELSGGERARVLIARALAQDARLIIADEPTSGLDPAHQLALLTLFRERARDGQAIVLSIHELHLAAQWCDRLILLHEGRIEADGIAHDVLTRNNMMKVYGCDARIISTPDGPIIIPCLAPTTEPSHHADH